MAGYRLAAPREWRGDGAGGEAMATGDDRMERDFGR